MLPLGIPQAHLVGSDDALIRDNLMRYIEAAEAAGDNPELITLSGAGHFELVAIDQPEWPRVAEAVNNLSAAGVGAVATRQ